MTSANQQNQPLLQNDPRDELNNSSLIHGPRHSKKRSATNASKRCHPNEKAISTSPVPTFWDSGDKFHEFEHHLRNHLRPLRHPITQKNKVQQFEPLARWSQRLLANIKHFHTDDTEKRVKRNCQKIAETIRKKLLDPTGIKSCLNHASNLLQFPEVAEQAFGNRASEFMETFLLGKKPFRFNTNSPQQASSKQVSRRSKPWIKDASSKNSYSHKRRLISSTKWLATTSHKAHSNFDQ